MLYSGGVQGQRWMALRKQIRRRVRKSFGYSYFQNSHDGNGRHGINKKYSSFGGACLFGTNCLYSGNFFHSERWRQVRRTSVNILGILVIFASGTKTMESQTEAVERLWKLYCSLLCSSFSSSYSAFYRPFGFESSRSRCPCRMEQEINDVGHWVGWWQVLLHVLRNVGAFSPCALNELKISRQFTVDLTRLKNRHHHSRSTTTLKNANPTELSSHSRKITKMFPTRDKTAVATYWYSFHFISLLLLFRFYCCINHHVCLSSSVVLKASPNRKRIRTSSSKNYPR